VYYHRAAKPTSEPPFRYFPVRTDHIANEIGVSHTTVQRARDSTASYDAVEEVRVGLDGNPFLVRAIHIRAAWVSVTFTRKVSKTLSV
jgi:hypothetical protein